jgi:hypothetical protein
MVKNLIIFVNLIGVFLVSLVTDQNISVSLEAPSSVNASEEFIVTLTINKGDIQSFSRFSQELPYGLTATRVTSSNADFSFEDQRVRFIWLKLPPEEQITVSYAVKVHERLKGSFSLGGEFSYIEGNDRKSVNVASLDNITIVPSPDIAKEMLVDITEFEKVLLPDMLRDQEFGELAVIRKPPVKTGTHEITVEMLVRKKDLNKFAKIEEQLPAGYRAVEGNSNGGMFSFSQGTVKLLWMNLPPASEFLVSYKIIPDPGKTLEDLSIRGSFSYITGNQTKSVGIVEKNYELAAATTRKDTTVADIREDVKTVIRDEPVENVLAKTDTVTTRPMVEKPMAVVAKPSGKSNFLESEEGIYYRVQLAAGHADINIQNYFRKLKIQEDVKMEHHEGWRKYSAGSFYTYKDARDYREKIRNGTPVTGAFVSAYHSGKRITVQEALMTANHKWYR